MRFRYQWQDQISEINLERQGDNYRAVIDGITYPFQVLEMQPGVITLIIDQRPVRLYWASDGDTKWISQDGCTYSLQRPSPRTVRRTGDKSSDVYVRAPMPAGVRSIHVQPGDWVKKGATLLLLEAMKMEIRVQAPFAGRVVTLLVEAGQTVLKDQTLVELDDAEEDAAAEGNSAEDFS